MVVIVLDRIWLSPMTPGPAESTVVAVSGTHAWRGEVDKAFYWLERAIAERHGRGPDLACCTAFSVMALPAVGYGDLHPAVPASKTVTIIYVVIGIGLFVAFITKVVKQRHHRGRKDDES
jgi:hypothetical protein